jgi:hypothetical protein
MPRMPIPRASFTSDDRRSHGNLQGAHGGDDRREYGILRSGVVAFVLFAGRSDHWAAYERAG